MISKRDMHCAKAHCHISFLLTKLNVKNAIKNKIKKGE